MRFIQYATFWGMGERDGFGQIQYLPPRVIRVRWEDRQELFLDKEGEETLSRARVFFDDNEIKNEDYLKLGISEETDPVSTEGAFKIRAILKTPNLRATKMECKAWL